MSGNKISLMIHRPTRSKSWGTILWVLICGWSMLPMGCERGPSTNVQNMDAVPLAVAKPIVRTITLTDLFTGRFKAVEEVEIRARVSGYLDQVFFKEGVEVKKGDLMVQIDPRPFDIDVASSMAQATSPQFYADIDREKALMLGVPLGSLFETLEIYLGSVFVNELNLYGRTYRVTAQADASFRDQGLGIDRHKPLTSKKM